MRQEEYDALMDVIEAKIDEKVVKALGSDATAEAIRFYDLQDKFAVQFIHGEASK